MGCLVVVVSVVVALVVVVSALCLTFLDGGGAVKGLAVFLAADTALRWLAASLRAFSRLSSRWARLVLDLDIVGSWARSLQAGRGGVAGRNMEALTTTNARRC